MSDWKKYMTDKEKKPKKKGWLIYGNTQLSDETCCFFQPCWRSIVEALKDQLMVLLIPQVGGEAVWDKITEKWI